jgi:hypothetical protein
MRFAYFQDMKGLSNIFEFLCGMASEEHKVIIFIDSLHNLSGNNEPNAADPQGEA